MCSRASRGRYILPDLFGRHDTLVVYSLMFGPEQRAAMSCAPPSSARLPATPTTSEQRVALAVVARAPIRAALLHLPVKRGWQSSICPLYSDPTEEYGRDYLAWTSEGDIAAYNVFTRLLDGRIRHFLGRGDEHGDRRSRAGSARPPDMTVLWNVLDTTPAGRDPKWYPKDGL